MISAIYAAVIIIVHDGLQSLVMFRDLRVHTHTHIRMRVAEGRMRLVERLYRR